MKKCIKSLFLRYSPQWLLLLVKKRHHLNTVKNASEFDEPDLKIVKYLVNKGDFVIDIGANIGVYTKMLSDFVGVDGQVNSFEPIPPTFEVLTSNIRSCKLKNVQTFNCALTDCDLKLRMEVPTYESGGENYYEAKIIDENHQSKFKVYEIQGKTLDSVIISNQKEVKFIKCDVEGNELFVIKGAKEVIQKYHPAFLIEVGSDPDTQTTNAFELFKLMASYGYQVYLLKDGNFRKRVLGDRSVNYFFLQEHHILHIQKHFN